MKYTNFIPIDSSPRLNSRREREKKQSNFNWRHKFSLTFCLLFCFFMNMSAQETWTGLVDGDWTNNGNWIDGTAPLSGVIPGNGILTINAGAPNAPTTNIPATISAQQLLVGSAFTIPSTVTVNIDGSSGAGDGVSTFHMGDLTVFGTLNVDKASMNGIEVGADGTDLLNFGTVTVTNSGTNGVLLTGTGSSVVDGNLTIDMSGGNGLQVDANHPLDHRHGSTITITKSNSDGIQNAGTVTSSGNITITGTTTTHGIQNTGTFTNDSLATIAITDIVMDGINSTGTFNNDGGNIVVGDGTAGSIGNQGIEVAGGTFNNFSTVAQGGGKVTVNGTTGDGLFITGTLTNGANAIGDTLGTIHVDNVNGNGIQIAAAGRLNNIQKSTIEINANGGNVKQDGLIGSGTLDNDDGSRVLLDGGNSAASFTGTVTNDGILEIVKKATFTGTGLTNNAIIKSTAPASSISGVINNNGIIIDPNNSFNSTLTSPGRTDALTSNNGVIVAPFTADCYADTVANFLITDLSNAALATFNYLPSSPFTMPGVPNAAVLDAANNVLRLNMVQSLMNFQYTATVVGTSCTADGAVNISFANVSAPPVACNNNVQVSLNANCTAVLTPDVVLEGDYSCYSGYTLEILEGDKAGTDTVDASYIGQTVRVMVSSPLGNSCWGTITVENKLPPVLTCRDTTIVCNTPTDPATIGGQPTATSSCNNDITYTYSDAVNSFNCRPGVGTAPDTISIITRTWRGTDSFGNSSTCAQTIYVVKPQLVAADIVWPEHDTLYCGNNPQITPEFTGYPRLRFNGAIVDIDQFCSFGVNYQDQEFTTSCPGERKILRVWTLYDWCHPNSVITNALSPGAQVIKVVDTVGPVISDLPIVTEITVNYNDLNSCMADLVVPPVVVSDECSDDISVKVQVGLTTINTNGGTLRNVPYGQQDVIYTATDGCGNITTDTVTVTIRDNIAPTVICKENLVISLTQNGTAQVLARAFDNGSYDNCDLDRIQVRRMDSCGVEMTLPFADRVDFQCCDVGRDDIMVELGVWDSVGNFNSCMVNVQIQDKVIPTLTCPPDVTVTCEADLTNLSIFGPAAVSGGACQNTPLDLVETRNLDNCGVGTIERTWTVPNTTVSCTQTITVTLVPNETFNITRMPQPIIYVQCDDGTDIEALGQDSLQVESTGCQLLAVSYNQKVFETTGQCKEVLRTWEIIDWCRNPQANPNSAGYRLVSQIVKLVDTIAPTFTNTLDTLFVDADHSRCMASVTLPAFTATDNCGTVSATRITGIIANSESGFDTLTNATAGTTILDVPVGTYEVFYTATDGCNNSVSQPLVIVVRDNEGPTIFCDDLVTTLTLKADEPASSNDRGWVTVWASDFNCKISDCDTTGTRQVLRFPSQGIGRTTPPADTSFGWTFNCATRGEQVGDLWVSDAAGNWDYVRVTVDIQDNMNVCPDISLMSAMISGNIETELGETVEDVTVNIGGYSMNPVLTGTDGKFEFGELPMHNNYTVAPEKNTAPLNGVSTYDLVLISKHILGIQTLDSPYKYIAADVNRSGTISAFDLVQLRQLILNVTTEFPNNNSWRFIDADYQFTSKNPAAESFAEVRSIGDLSADTQADFVAVKIGDVNTNATANRGLVSGESRTTTGTLAFKTEDIAFKAGEVVTANFDLTDLAAVEGYQFTMNVDLSKVEIVGVEEGVAKAHNFGTQSLEKGRLTTSWIQGSEALQGTENMFALTLKAKTDGILSEVVAVSSDITKAEAYNTSGELLDVALAFNTNQTTTTDFVLYNNRPNPFQDVTTIGFEMPTAGNARLTIFNVSGSIVHDTEQEYAKGYNEVRIEKAVLQGSGIYFYQLETATHTAKKKMILID